jgi:hypothetical protein
VRTRVLLAFGIAAQNTAFGCFQTIRSNPAAGELDDEFARPKYHSSRMGLALLL